MTETTTNTATETKYTLKMLAEAKRLSSLRALAEGAGIDPDRLYAISSGKVQDMSAEELLRLSNYTGIHPALIEIDYSRKNTQEDK
jgi:hypothetical protein